MGRIAVLKGGSSLERQVSLRSAARVEDALERLGHEVVPVDVGGDLVERFPQFRERLERRLPTLNQVNRQQIELLRRYRAAPGETAQDSYLAPLLLSINCIAAGFGTTG